LATMKQLIKVQTDDFDHAHEYAHLREQAQHSGASDGAIVTFTGLVRDFNIAGSVSGLFIEHYPGMTEKALDDICNKARERWDLGQITVIHRVGHINADEQIVFVGVTSRHRKNAIESTEFIMDYLKHQAPFWKQEATGDGMQWVEQKASDVAQLKRWNE
jgi:molybdopterin synthase catalytic subunit